MFVNKLLRDFLKVFAVLFLFSPCFAQLKLFCTFEGVEIPHKLIYRDIIIEKGRYDLEAVKHPNTPIFYLKIKQGKNVLCMIEAERLDYPAGFNRKTDPNIPNQCTLKMSKNPEEKVFSFTVHSGRKNRMFALLLLRFRLQYEE